jgi:hypothetical protein
LDETRPQNTANTVRVWSFERIRIIKNTTKFDANPHDRLYTHEHEN